MAESPWKFDVSEIDQAKPERPVVAISAELADVIYRETDGAGKASRIVALINEMLDRKDRSNRLRDATGLCLSLFGLLDELADDVRQGTDFQANPEYFAGLFGAMAALAIDAAQTVEETDDEFSRRDQLSKALNLTPGTMH